MSANLLETVLLGVLNEQVLNFVSPTQIGGIQVDTTVEEFYEDALEVTEHPVQRGAQITDHSYKRPMELVLNCGWSDSSISGFTNLLNPLVEIPTPLTPFGGGNPTAGTAGSFSGGSMSASDYVANIYSQLLQLQESRQPIAVVCGLRSYDSMLITALRVRRDEKQRFTLSVHAFLKQVILVDTQLTTVPPQANQATPKKTADVVNAGTQQLQQSTSPVSPLIKIYPGAQASSGPFAFQ